MLRDYQQDAVNAAVKWMKTSLEPCVIAAPTGSGKSHLVASTASWLHEVSGGKRVLCLQPSKELTEQNYEKFTATGNNASLFSASLGSFSTRYPVVYGTDKTVKNRLQRFLGGDYCGVILDEAHGTTPTIRNIVDTMREANLNLRVLGLTATPYRLGEGYIYQYDEFDNLVPSKKPFFFKCVYSIDARYLISKGYLTPPRIGDVMGKGYDTSGLVTNSMGKFTKDSVDMAYLGKGRLTSAIVADVVGRSQGRSGVMFFCATIAHAEEVMTSLPPHLSKVVTGKTPADERAGVLKAFKAGRLKYLVNVDVLTTGFDAPNVDTIALLRHTESAGLLQQIVGRGLRILEGKVDCLVLDYAENIKKHCPDGDIFRPEIKVKGDSEGKILEAICPSCQHANLFTERHPEDFMYQGGEIDKHGYYEHTSVPAHYGRRCTGYEMVKGVSVRCDYRWAGKDCPECGADNDIAARFCRSCKAEMVDPNEKLKIEFARFIADPYLVHTDEVTGWECNSTLSKAGNECWKINVETPYRQFTYWIKKGSYAEEKLSRALDYKEPTTTRPNTITYKKNRESQFFDVIAYNKPIDTDGGVGEPVVKKEELAPPTPPPTPTLWDVCYGAESYPTEATCHKCGKVLPFTPRPDTPHYGSVTCPEHGFKWIPKPKELTQ